LLAGISVAIAKIFRPKPEPSAVIDLGRPTGDGVHEWPPLESATPTPTPTPAPEPEPAPEPTKPAAKKAAPKKTLDPWVDPDGNTCPDTHPVKGKLSSKIFQVPGNFAYDRTNPDRCYQSADAAAADGMRPAKR
jgi:hypothetical protein